MMTNDEMRSLAESAFAAAPGADVLVSLYSE